MQKRCVSVVIGLAGLAAGAHAQPRVEVTKSGELLPVIVSEVENVGATVLDSPGPFELTPAWTLELRRQVGSVRIGDLNNDGINDLAVGCYISNSFPPYEFYYDMVFYGTGNAAAPLPAAASWTAAQQYHTGDLQLADINKDGLLDMVAITGGTAFSPPRIYFGLPAGGIETTAGWVATPPKAGWATSGLVFDVNNDGFLDLLTTNQGISPDPYRPMYLFLNNNGTLSTTPAWQSVEPSIQNTAAAVDLNKDGFPEVAVAKWVAFESGVYPNNAGQLGPSPTWTVGTTAADRGVATGDVNGDGSVDVALGSPNGTRLYLNEAGTLQLVYTSTPPFNGAQEILLEDVDLDGDLDLLEVHFSDGRTHVYLNSGGVLPTTPSWTFDASTVANAIAVGDLNGDGHPDLAVGYSGDTSVRVFYGIPPAPSCYANCDGSTATPVLNVADFGCFLSKFASGDPYANCDGSTAAPVLNVADFGCFLSKFAAGCR